MKYQIWIEEHDESEEITLLREDQSKSDNQVSENATLHAEFEASSYNEAMTKMHETMGFEPYKPF